MKLFPLKAVRWASANPGSLWSALGNSWSVEFDSSPRSESPQRQEETFLASVSAALGAVTLSVFPQSLLLLPFRTYAGRVPCGATGEGRVWKSHQCCCGGLFWSRRWDTAGRLETPPDCCSVEAVPTPQCVFTLSIFIIWGEFLEGKSSKHSKIKNVSCKLLIKGHEKNFVNETNL